MTGARLVPKWVIFRKGADSTEKEEELTTKDTKDTKKIQVRFKIIHFKPQSLISLI